MSDRQSCRRTCTMFKSLRRLFKIKAQVRLPRSLLDSLSVGITTEDGAQRIKYANMELPFPSALLWRGYQKAAVRGKHFSSDPAARQACQGR